MAISKHEQQLRQQMFENFKKFNHLYRAKVEFTGEKIRKVDSLRVPFDPSQSITYTETNEISIKMPQDEFERFMNHWGAYIDMLDAAQEHHIIGEEFNKLLMLVNLLK